MAELDFTDLIPSKQEASAAISFDDLVPRKSEASSVPAAITDVPKEIGSAGTQALQNITGNSISDLPGYDARTRGQLGPIEGLMRTGKQFLGVPELLVSPLVGAARSLIGHPMADLTHQAGKVIAPEIAAKQDPQKLYETAKVDVDLALSGARPRVPRTVTLDAPTIADLKSASTAAYKSPEITGLELQPGAIRDYSVKLKSSLNQDGFDDIVAPKTFSLLDRIEKAPEGAVFTGRNLDSFRKTLGKVASSTDATEKAAASIAIEHLDDFLPKISSKDVIAGDVGAAAAKFAEARGNYAAAKQSEKLDKKTQKAEMQADTSNSGMNLENRIRTQMGKIKIDDREARGLTPGERAQAATISEGTPTQNTMRALGNVMGGGGGMATVVAGLPTAGIAPALGFGLKVLSNRMTLKQAQGLSEAIRRRAPLASSVEKFGEAFAKFQAEKSASNYAGTVVAARNLSSNLQGAGLDGAIGGLLRSLAVPGQGAAEDSQEAPRRE